MQAFKKVLWWIAALFVGVPTFLIAFESWTAVTESKKARELQAGRDSEAKVVAEKIEARIRSGNLEFDDLAASKWIYESDVDSMNSRPIRYATVQALTPIKLTRHSSASFYPTLTVRRNSDGTTDVIIRITQGQFVCRIGGCVLPVRLDNATPINFTAVEPSDFNSKTLFITPGKRLASKIEKAKLLRVETTLFQEGNHVITFLIAGLEAK